MKINKTIVIGLLFTIIGLFDCLNNPAHLASIILTGVGIFAIVSGLFEIKNYHNKKLYFAIITVLIASLLILTYISLSSRAYPGNSIIDSTYIVLMPLLLAWWAYDFTKKGKLF